MGGTKIRRAQQAEDVVCRGHTMRVDLLKDNFGRGLIINALCIHVCFYGMKVRKEKNVFNSTMKTEVFLFYWKMRHSLNDVTICKDKF